MAKNGTNYTAKWTLDDEGVLTIAPKSGTSGILRYSWEDSPLIDFTSQHLNWYIGLADSEVASVKQIIFSGSITFQIRTENIMGGWNEYANEGNMIDFFGQFTNLENLDVTGLVTDGIWSAHGMFSLPKLTQLVGSSQLTFGAKSSSTNLVLSNLFANSMLTNIDISGISSINEADIDSMFQGANYCTTVALPTSMARDRVNLSHDYVGYMGLSGDSITATNTNGITITTDADFFKLPSGQQGGVWTRDISKSASLTASINSATRSANTATISLTYACTSAEINIYAKKSSEADYPSEADLTQSITGTGTLSLELELATDDAYDMQVTVSDGTTNLYFFPSVDSNILLAEIDESGALKVNGLTIGDYEHIAPDYQQNYDDPGTKSLSSGTSWTDTGCTLTLDEGIWMVTAAIYYPNPSNGSTVSARACRVYNHQSGDSIGYIATDQRAGRNDYASTAHTTFSIKITADEAPTKLEVQGYQNSGKSLTTRPRLYAARIG